MTPSTEPLAGRCATCLHWQGDKKKAEAMVRDTPESMDLFNGWPDDGDCGISYEFLDLEISGDASVAKKFNANFGCVYWLAG